MHTMEMKVLSTLLVVQLGDTLQERHYFDKFGHFFDIHQPVQLLHLLSDHILLLDFDYVPLVQPKVFPLSFLFLPHFFPFSDLITPVKHPIPPYHQPVPVDYVLVTVTVMCLHVLCVDVIQLLLHFLHVFDDLNLDLRPVLSNPRLFQPHYLGHRICIRLLKFFLREIHSQRYGTAKGATQTKVDRSLKFVAMATPQSKSRLVVSTYYFLVVGLTGLSGVSTHVYFEILLQVSGHVSEIQFEYAWTFIASCHYFAQ